MDFLNPRQSPPLGIRATATLSDLHRDGAWLLRPARTENQVLLHSHLMTITLTDTPDHYE